MHQCVIGGVHISSAREVYLPITEVQPLNSFFELFLALKSCKKLLLYEFKLLLEQLINKLMYKKFKYAFALYITKGPLNLPWGEGTGSPSANF